MNRVGRRRSLHVGAYSDVVELPQCFLECLKRTQSRPLSLLRGSTFEQALEELRCIAKLFDLNSHLVALFRIKLHQVPASLDDFLPAPAEFLLSQHRYRLSTTLVGGLVPIPQPISRLDPSRRLQD